MPASNLTRFGTALLLAAAMTPAAEAADDLVLPRGAHAHRIDSVARPTRITISTPFQNVLWEDWVERPSGWQYDARMAIGGESIQAPLDPQPDRFDFSAGRTTLSPSGQGAVFTRCGGDGCRIHLYVVGGRTSRGDPVEMALPIDDAGASLSVPAVSGDRVAFVSTRDGRSSVRVHDASKGTITDGLDTPAGWETAGTFSALAIRGDTLAATLSWRTAAGAESAVYVRDLRTGVQRRILRTTRQTFAPGFMGRHLYFARAGRRTVLHRYHLRRRRLLRANAPARLAWFAIARPHGGNVVFYVTARSGQGPEALCAAASDSSARGCRIYEVRGTLPRFR